MPDPIELYYWPTPNGWKVSILLEELGLPYRVHPVDITKGDQFDPDFLKIAPNNRMPAIVDPDGPDGAPISVFESGAIMLYLARKTGRLMGATERGRIAVEEWLMWQMGGLGPMAGQAVHFRQYAPERLGYPTTRYMNEVNRLYGVLDRRLAGRDYVAGDYSIADIAIWTWAHLWKRHGQDISAFPRMRDWIGRIGARPAVLRGRAVLEDVRKGISVDADGQRLLFQQKSR